MKKGTEEEVWAWFAFFFWLVMVDLRKDKKGHAGLCQSSRAPGVLSLAQPLVDDCTENTRNGTSTNALARDPVSQRL